MAISCKRYVSEIFQQHSVRILTCFSESGKTLKTAAIKVLFISGHFFRDENERNTIKSRLEISRKKKYQTIFISSGIFRISTGIHNEIFIEFLRVSWDLSNQVSVRRSVCAIVIIFILARIVGFSQSPISSANVLDEEDDDIKPLVAILQAVVAAGYSKQLPVMGTVLNAMSARRQCCELQLEKTCILIQRICSSSGKSKWNSSGKVMFRMWI